MRSLEEIRNNLMEELKRYENCNHDFDEKPVSFTTVGRFGGHAVNIYRCKKCGYEGYKKEEYEEALSHYDKAGRPID